ncbi:MAG: DEAD/DEAH box helicase [Deltaproteobacteria bacterium]|nr:MAG: DEAD/DEAH box helicase [Deltaproteobacteria bacterium]
MKFDELNLLEPLLAAVRDLGFEHPTEIQESALPLVLAGRDVAGQAQTGTGKTACFLLGTLNALLQSERPEDGSPRALVIAPTRELAIQIAADAEALTTYTDLKTTIVCGGLSWDKQARALQDGTDIVVGTPGRLMDYERKRILKLKKLQSVVVDEADRMFDMGFIQDINHLFRYMPPKSERQSMLFSATLSAEVMRLARRHMSDPVEVNVAPEQLVVEEIEQSLYHVANREKVSLLLGLLQREQPQRTMIFVNRKVDGEALTWRLNHNGYESVYLSGDLPQKKRLKIIEGMKAGKIEILVATDVASRGIHVDDVTHVFNYDVPQDPEDYVHRIGRTARAGASGKAITLACEETVMSLPAVEELIERRIPVEFADDELYIPDRAGRFRRTKQVYTGWPPASLGTSHKDDDDDDDEVPSEATSDEKKKRRRRRRRRSGEPGAEGAPPEAVAAAPAE